MVGPSCTKLIFDVLLPYEVEEYTAEEVEARLRTAIKQADNRYVAEITVDRS